MAKPLQPAVLRSPIKQVKRARRLRRELSLPEVLLLKVLRTRPGGLKFRHQFPIGRMTVDFVCLSHRLAIEVDGEAHNFADQAERDMARDGFLREQGFDVLRIGAQDVLDNLDGVVSAIVARCSEMGPLHHPLGGPPPRSGEE